MRRAKTLRLSKTEARRLRDLADRYGVSETDVLRFALQHFAALADGADMSIVCDPERDRFLIVGGSSDG